jgi:putative ABC transport system permease protein
MKWLWFAVKNVLRNRRRSAITVVIAAVGTASLLVCGGFVQYVYALLRRVAASDSGHVVLAHRDYFEEDEDVPMRHGLQDAPAVKARLEADPRVSAALPRLQFSGLLSNGENSAVFIGTGIDAAGEFRVRGSFLWEVTAGTTLEERPRQDELPEIMLGKDLARQLRASPGSTLTLLATTTEGSLNAQDVRVRGIYTVGVPDLDRRAILVHLVTAQRLLLTDRVSTVSAYLRRLEDTDAMYAAMAELFPGRALRTWREQAFYYRAVRALYNRIFGVLGAVIVVLVLFAVSNTLGMAVVERTREIGTFCALGAFPGQVTRNFVMEGLVMGAAGAAAGMVLAALVSLALDRSGVMMPPPPGYSVGYPLLVERSLALYAGGASIVVSVSGLAAWFVSRKAAARPIVEALAHV